MLLLALEMKLRGTILGTVTVYMVEKPTDLRGMELMERNSRGPGVRSQQSNPLSRRLTVMDTIAIDAATFTHDRQNTHTDNEIHQEGIEMIQ